VAVFLVGAASPAAQNATFSSRLDAVRVDALVTEGGKPVHGLTAADFDVLDNGVRQSVDLVSFEELPVNVMLALDLSSSLTGERLEHLRAAGHTLLDGLQDNDRAGLITFSRAVVTQAPLGVDLTRVRAGLDRAGGSNDTALIDASYEGLMMSEADTGRSLLIVFTDGVDTASWLTADNVLDTARHSDVVVYGIEVGARGPGFLRNLTESSGGRLLDVDSTKDLNEAFNTILQEFRQRYLISYSLRGTPAGGWHRLDVRVKGRRTVKARPGYFSQ